MSQVLELEAATLADMLAIYLPTEMHAHGGSVAADAMRTVSSIMRLLVVLSWFFFCPC